MRVICFVDYGFGVPILSELAKVGKVILVRKGEPSKAHLVKLRLKLMLGLISKCARDHTKDVVAVGAFRARVPTKWTRTAGSPEFIAWLASKRPDLIVSAGFGEVLRPEAIACATWAVHFHPSLLPAYRGPMPSYWIIRNGEVISGATCYHLTERVNEGDIIFQEPFDVPPTLAVDDHEALAADKCARMVPDLIAGLRARHLPGRRQDQQRASYYGFAPTRRV